MSLQEEIKRIIQDSEDASTGPARAVAKFPTLVHERAPAMLDILHDELFPEVLKGERVKFKDEEELKSLMAGVTKGQEIRFINAPTVPLRKRAFYNLMRIKLMKPMPRSGEDFISVF
jgi:hypothetical protein